MRCACVVRVSMPRSFPASSRETRSSTPMPAAVVFEEVRPRRHELGDHSVGLSVVAAMTPDHHREQALIGAQMAAVEGAPASPLLAHVNECSAQAGSIRLGERINLRGPPLGRQTARKQR